MKICVKAIAAVLLGWLMVVDLGFVSEMTLTVACCFMLLYDALLYLKKNQKREKTGRFPL